jgi:hypothetical protein|nr:hypothetical protein [Candidatus Krumholzibacteria bacterium]
MKNNLKTMVALGLVLMLTGLLGACESDSVSPKDETPELTQENVAYQAAIVALAMVEVGPRVIDFTPAKNVYTYSFTGYEYVEGDVEIDFRTGGASGEPATPSNADYARLVTLGDTGLTVTYDGLAGSAMSLTADIQANLDQVNDTATIFAPSGGSMVSGVYTGTFDIDGVVVGVTGYPTAGTITFTAGGHTLAVTFNGTANVPVSVNGTTTWMLNLSDGELSEVMPPM